MKAKMVLSALAIVFLLSSCGAHCQADKWRKKRFVQSETPTQNNYINRNTKAA